MDKAIKNKRGLEAVISLSLGHKKIQVKKFKTTSSEKFLYSLYII